MLTRSRKIEPYWHALSIRPESTIPITLDLGTNNKLFLNDPFYLGSRQERVPEKEMTEFMDEFMYEMSVAFPKLMVQFEVHSIFSKLTSKLNWI